MKHLDCPGTGHKALCSKPVTGPVSQKGLKVPSDDVLYMQVRCKEENIDPSKTKQWEEMTTRVEGECRL